MPPTLPRDIRKRFDPDTHYAVMMKAPEAPTAHIRRRYLNIPYARASFAQCLDIYLPQAGEGPFPVILALHGGAFMGGDKGDMQVLPMLAGLERGYAVAAANYRLSWEAPFPALVVDVKAAVRWLRANAAWFHLDPQRIAAWGGSAGGYLATMLGVSAAVPELQDLALGNPEQPCHVQAVVDWYGPTDFLAMDEQLAASGLAPMPGTEHSGIHSPESLLLGAAIPTIPDLVRAADPLTYVGENAAPFLIQHGRADSTVPYQQSLRLAERLERLGGGERVSLELFADFEHADPRLESPVNVQRVLDFIDAHLRPGQA